MRALLIGAALCLAGPAMAKKGPRWHTVDAPTAGPSTAIGSYAGGCLNGGVALPAKGVGYETIRRWRNRFYAHPDLARFLDGFGKRVKAAGLPTLLVGDISQPRGGRMKSGHRSHQIGLDADIWFDRPRKRDKDEHFRSLVDRKRETINRDVFAPEHVQVLEMAAKDPAVARIFVSWVIKRELCASVQGDRSWLPKIRPWYGHRRHFHVRLHCPAASPDCRPQRAVPTTDDCGNETWFSRAEKRKRRLAAKAGKAVKRSGRRASRRTQDHVEPCAEVLAAPSVESPGGRFDPKIISTKKE